MKRKDVRNLISTVCYLLTFSICGYSQFSSGSTGADGALDTSTMNCPSSICFVQLPESGILNYTTINIASGKVLLFRPNSRNSPVTLLAQGNVIIGGELSVSSPCIYFSPGNPDCLTGREPGPGGFYGGQQGQNGFGPGGALISNCLSNANGQWVGPLTLVPNIGGSGAAGISSGCQYGGSGSGGGGAITIASSTSITIAVGGGVGANTTQYVYSSGSGGAIRLVANSLNIAGALRASSPGGGVGVIRLEANDGQRIFTGSAYPPATLASINPAISLGNQPQLTIASIGGYSVPSYSGSRFDAIDVLLPKQIPDPVNVGVNAGNVPVGTEVKVGFVSGSSSGTSVPCNLVGTLASSSCTVTISNLDRSLTVITYLLATAAFSPPSSLAQYNPKGPNQVARIKLEAVLGARPKYAFLNRNGKVIETAKLRKEFVQFFGM